MRSGAQSNAMKWCLVWSHTVTWILSKGPWCRAKIWRYATTFGSCRYHNALLAPAEVKKCLFFFFSRSYYYMLCKLGLYCTKDSSSASLFCSPMRSFVFPSSTSSGFKKLSWAIFHDDMSLTGPSVFNNYCSMLNDTTATTTHSLENINKLQNKPTVKMAWTT